MTNELKDIFDYVDSHQEAFLSELRELCAFDSTAENPEGLEHTRNWLLKRLNSAGLEKTLIPVPNGNAMIYGSGKGKSEKTILFYNHYDVVEPGKNSNWTSKQPFNLTRDGSLIYARGVSDNKGPLLSRIQAAQAILAVRNELPVNVKFLMEGDEETSSPSMSRYQNENEEQFRDFTKADVCFWENGRNDQNGSPWVRFGVRGACAFDLKVTTSKKDVHGRMGATVPSASWRLIWALNTLKGSDERILIEGFYDDVLPPTTEELSVLKNFPYDENSVKRNMGMKEFLLGKTGEELKQRIYLEPTLSVCGIEAGELYNGPRGIVPHTAWARISFYLVANQDPVKIKDQLRRHLDQKGFSDVEVEYLGGTWPVKTATNIPEAELLTRAAAKVYDKPLVKELTQLGSGPAVILRRAWPNMPIIGAGPGNNGSNHHAPDENLSIEDYIRSIKFMIAFMYEYQG